MRYIVVEPHPDDAFLSLGFHLQELWKEEDRLIVTVFADKVRTKEAEEYAKAIGAKSLVIGLPETKMLSRERPRKIPELLKVREELSAGGGEDIYLFPLGLQHPDHRSVAASRSPGDLRYLEIPYQSKIKLGDDVRNGIEGKSLYSLAYPPKKKWKHIPLFKTQSKFFYYNANLPDLRIPEIIVR